MNSVRFWLLCCTLAVWVCQADGSVAIRTFVEGNGVNIPRENDTVVVHYTGSLVDGRVFDSSRSQGRQPLEFVVGRGQVINGWDVGLQHMSLGQRGQIIITYEDAYGSVGQMDANPPIYPFATLLFDVEVLQIRKPQVLQPTLAPPQPGQGQAPGAVLPPPSPNPQVPGTGQPQAGLGNQQPNQPQFGIDPRLAFGNQQSGMDPRLGFGQQQFGFGGQQPGGNQQQFGFNGQQPGGNQPQIGFNGQQPGGNQPQIGFNGQQPGGNQPFGFGGQQQQGGFGAPAQNMWRPRVPGLWGK